MNPLLWILHLLLPLASGFSPQFDINGRVKDISEALIVIEAHGKNIAIPRRAFENPELLKVGAPARARVQVKDLREIRY